MQLWRTFLTCESPSQVENVRHRHCDSPERYDDLMCLEMQIKQLAQSLGFDLAGIAAATPADSFEKFQDWLEKGYAGEMDYMERHEGARKDPSSILPEVRSVVIVGMNYKPAEGMDDDVPAGFGRVARY